jgi:hypothetical protein
VASGTIDPAVLDHARKLLDLVRFGRIQHAEAFRSIINQHGEPALRDQLGIDGDEWRRILYAVRLDRYESALRQVRESIDDGDRPFLADVELLVDCLTHRGVGIEPWEIDIQPADLARLLQPLYREAFAGKIKDYREAGSAHSLSSASFIADVFKLLGYRYQDLGTTQEEVEGWLRQERIRIIRGKFGIVHMMSDSLTVALNVPAAVRQMHQYGISPADAGISPEELAQAKRILTDWLPRAIRHPDDKCGDMLNRNELIAIRDKVMPLFDRI